MQLSLIERSVLTIYAEKHDATLVIIKRGDEAFRLCGNFTKSHFRVFFEREKDVAPFTSSNTRDIIFLHRISSRFAFVNDEEPLAKLRDHESLIRERSGTTRREFPR